MCSRTSQPPRRDLYALATELRTNEGPFFMPKSDRRWTYKGTEAHYGYTYHLWQNELTQRKYAWEVEAYRDALTKESAHAK